MRVSRKAQYALRAIVELARKPAAPNVSIEELTVSGTISPKVLQQVLLSLKQGGLLRSRRGLGGGYQLSRPADSITLGDVLRAVDGPFHPISCAAEDPAQFGAVACECGVAGGCGLGSIFTDLQKMVNEFLDGTTLTDVIAREVSGEAMHFDI